MRPRGLRGGARAFVGRDSELELLQAIYRHAVEQRGPHVVTLMGDAGVGKTTLVRELWQWLADQAPQPLQRTGRCLAYGHVTYWALGEILREQLGILEDAEQDAARRRLGDREILGLALGLDVAGDAHPLAVRDLFQEAWVEFLSELAAETPTVVLVEDLHWAEDPLLDLLERVSRDVRGPLLVIGTARPELLDRRPAWGGGRRNASLVWLDALSPVESAAVLDELVPGVLSPETRSALVERAEGNPFFLEELLAAFVETGTVVEELPDSVQAILSARVDRLPSGDKAALQAASVIGRIFWTGPTLELVGGEAVDWAVLEDRDFIRRRSGSSIRAETEYAFKHALTREVVYASVPKARRAPLHAAFAAWLERTGGGRDEDAALLAHHYAQAASPEDADLAWTDDPDELERLRPRAVHWLRRAGRAGDPAVRPRRGHGRPPARARAVRTSGTLRPLARHRPRERAQVRRPALLGGDEARPEADRRHSGAGRHSRRPRVPDVDSVRDVAATAGPRGGRGLDSEGARARGAGEPRPCPGAHRARVLESVGGARRRARRKRARRAVGRSRPALLRLGRAVVRGVRAARLRGVVQLGAAAGRPAAPDRRPGPPHRDLRGARPAVRADRPLRRGAAAGGVARRDRAAADAASPHPLDRDGARGQGADGRVDVDPRARAGRRASRRREPRHAVHPERALAARRSGRARLRRRARRRRAGSRSARSRSPSRASASGCSARASDSPCCATSSTSSTRCSPRTSPAAATTGWSPRRW